MKKLFAVLMLTGCAATMEATPTELLAVGGLQSKLGSIEQAVGNISSDRQTQQKILSVAFAIVEVERAERDLSLAAGKARGFDEALILSGSTWRKP